MSNLVSAVSVTVDLLTAINELTAKVGATSAIIKKAHTEGRDLTDEELATCRAMDDAARERLEKLLA